MYSHYIAYVCLSCLLPLLWRSFSVIFRDPSFSGEQQKRVG